MAVAWRFFGVTCSTCLLLTYYAASVSHAMTSPPTALELLEAKCKQAAPPEGKRVQRLESKEVKFVVGKISLARKESIMGLCAEGDGCSQSDISVINGMLNQHNQDANHEKIAFQFSAKMDSQLTEAIEGSLGKTFAFCGLERRRFNPSNPQAFYLHNNLFYLEGYHD